MDVNIVLFTLALALLLYGLLRFLPTASRLVYSTAIGRGVSSSDTVVLLTGPSGTGKTRLFAQLARLPSNIATHPSLAVNCKQLSTTTSNTASSVGSEAKVSSVQLQLIDIPGHPKLRERFLSEQLSGRSCSRLRLVYLLNYQPSQQRQLHETTEYLYHIISLLYSLRQLQRLRVGQQHIQLLLAVNRVQSAFLPQIRRQLESEFNQIRQSLAATQHSIHLSGDEFGGEGQKLQDLYLGYDGLPFNFDHLDDQLAVDIISAEDSQALGDWILYGDTRQE